MISEGSCDAEDWSNVKIETVLLNYNIIIFTVFSDIRYMP